MMAELCYIGEDMSTETLNHELYRLYHSAEEDFDPFQLAIKRAMDNLLTLPLSTTRNSSQYYSIL